MGIFDNMANEVEQAAVTATEGELRQLALNAVDRLPGGLQGVTSKLIEGGLGPQVSQWQAGNPVPVSAEDIHGALGEQSIQAASQSLGIPHADLIAALAQHLPTLVASKA